MGINITERCSVDPRKKLISSKHVSSKTHTILLYISISLYKDKLRFFCNLYFAVTCVYCLYYRYIN